MESSDGGTNIADCSAGSIVWVRRRNGSWWPGKILGPDELSASHLMSPRSGTPVKLLGREDASVDWYNLEKSKRVKAFRCGDFDECIERAEASQGMPPKKREKYARREDAILHALELEKQLVEKKHGKLGYSINASCSKPLDDIEKDVVMCSEQLRYGNEKKSHSRSHQVSRRLHPSLKEGTNQPSLPHDESGAVPRMRGLQDIGLKTASSKSKISSSVTSNDSQKPTFHNEVHDLPNGDRNVGHTLNTKSETLLDKKRKINEGLVDEFLIKRRDRRRPLVQVMQSSAKFSVPLLQPDSDIVSISVSGEDQLLVACHTEKNGLAHLSAESCDHVDDQETHPGRMETLLSKFEENNHLQSSALSGENTSGSTEDTETDSSYTDSFDSDTDEEIDSLSDDAASIELEPKYFGGSLERAEHRSISGEESHDLALADDMSHSCLNDPSSVSTVVSKWQLKGKRNNRNLVKRSLDVSNKKVPRGSIYGTELEEKESDYGSCEATMIEKNCKTQMIDYGSRGLHGTRHFIDLEDFTWNDRPVMKGYREEPEEYIDPVFVGRQHFGSRIKSVLVDVDLKVKSSYQKEHVPIISLMSKLNGQAIVGHPIQIEALENGSSDALLVDADECFPELLEKDSALSPVWRTARRTANFRVPRPHVSTLDGDETAKHPPHADKDREACFRKSNAGSSGHKAITTRKSLPRTSTNRKFRRQPKKMSLSSSQKIRTLSSISPLNLSIDLKHSGNSYQVDRLIKPVSVFTALACIPVKLVFSRLNEALVGRH